MVRVDSISATNLQETRLAIEGMTCRQVNPNHTFSILRVLIVLPTHSACTGAITRHCQTLPGVSDVDVNLVLNSAVLIHHPDSLSVDTLINEINELGYGATLIASRNVEKNVPPLRRTLFGLEGMTCR
jgi:copper chaperone CopZ